MEQLYSVAGVKVCLLTYLPRSYPIEKLFAELKAIIDVTGASTPTIHVVVLQRF